MPSLTYINLATQVKRLGLEKKAVGRDTVYRVKNRGRPQTPHSTAPACVSLHMTSSYIQYMAFAYVYFNNIECCRLDDIVAVYNYMHIQYLPGYACLLNLRLGAYPFLVCMQVHRQAGRQADRQADRYLHRQVKWNGSLIQVHTYIHTYLIYISTYSAQHTYVGEYVYILDGQARPRNLYRVVSQLGTLTGQPPAVARCPSALESRLVVLPAAANVTDNF